MTLSASIPDQRFARLSQFKIMEWLFWLRNFMILAQVGALLVAVHFLKMPLALGPISLAPGVLLVFNMLVYWRLEKGHSVSVLEMMLHLLFDMLVFTYLLYWTGGSANPFVSAYLVPVALAAVFGTLRHALALGVLSGILYSFLMLRYVPLPPINGRFGGDFSLHVFGMWLNFILSAIITIVFVSSMAKLAREREIALKQVEQESLNNQHMVALGALAAGAAHELATPLSNIGMLADELADSSNDAQTSTQLFASLNTQLGICQSQISMMRDQAGMAQHPEPVIGTAKGFIDDSLRRFKAVRSDIAVKVHASADHSQSLEYDLSLSQTLLSLLNNAADASVDNGHYELKVSYEIVAGMLCLNIDDFGVGVDPAYEHMMGTVPFSSKQGGVGIGLLLASANINRMGGQLALYNLEHIGARAEIKLPILYDV